jgi:hypothetical protein
MRNNPSAILTRVLIWVAIFFPAGALALSYELAQSIEVITEPIEEEGGFAPIQWRIAPELDINGMSIIRFSRQKSGESACCLRFSKSSVDISWDGRYASPDLIHSEDLLIVPGVPVPCNVLPVEKLFSADEPVLYEIRRQAGGRTFVDRVQVSRAAVAYEAAINRGWVKAPGSDAKTALHLIKAVDLRTGELMVQQLWADGHSWWIYEETPYHRSWRVR